MPPSSMSELALTSSVHPRFRRALAFVVQRMENENGLSDPNSFSYNGRYAPLPPYPFSGVVESKGNFKSLESANNCHQCRSSESFLAEEEQPSWLDDLLNDSETFTHRGHRRSASDSYAFLGGEAAATLTSKFVNLSVEDSFETKANSNADDNNNNQELEELVYNIAVDHRRDESSSQSTEGSGDRASGAQANISGSKAESKRAKQHNAHRSRVRKLQYIAHLERTVQILKAEGTEVSAELEFLEQQNLILIMENRALRQRMESISQEQIIKHWEQGMLEREIGRLQTLYHLQNQQQMQMHHQQKQQQPNKGHPKHRRNRSRDHLDHQINNSTLKNKDVRDSVNGHINGPIRA